MRIVDNAYLGVKTVALSTGAKTVAPQASD